MREKTARKHINLFARVGSSSAARTASGVALSSRTMSCSFLPAMPPAALTCSTASSIPLLGGLQKRGLSAAVDFANLDHALCPGGPGRQSQQGRDQRSCLSFSLVLDGRHGLRHRVAAIINASEHLYEQNKALVQSAWGNDPGAAFS